MFFTNAHCATLFAFAMTCRATGLHCPGKLRAAQCELRLPLQTVNRLHHALFAFKLAAFDEQVVVGQIAFLQSVEDVARYCVGGGNAGELFDGNIGKLGQVVHDLPFDANDG